MLKIIGIFLKKFLLLNLVFGIGMCVGSAIGTTVTLGMYGLPDVSVERPEAPKVETCEVEDGN